MPINKVVARDLQVGDQIENPSWDKPAHIQRVTVVVHTDNNMDWAMDYETQVNVIE